MVCRILALALAIDRCWTGLDGDVIPDASVANVILASGSHAHHYGECTYDGARAILDALDIAPGSTFADLGSGVGKLTVQAYCERPIAAALGVELARERHDKAVEGWRRLRDDARRARERHSSFDESAVRFVCDDIFNVDLNDVTHCYAANLLFDTLANRQLAHLFDELPNLRRVATLERLDSLSDRFTLRKTTEAAMSWNRASSSQIYVYSRS